MAISKKELLDMRHIEVSDVNTVVQSNKLVSALSDLSVNSYKILYSAISALTNEDEELPKMYFEVNDLKVLFTAKSTQAMNKEIEQAVAELKNAIIYVKEDDSYIPLQVIEEIEYCKTKKVLYLHLAEDMEKYLIQLSSKMTIIPVNFLLLMKTSASIKLLSYLIMLYSSKVYFATKNNEKSIVSQNVSIYPATLYQILCRECYSSLKNNGEKKKFNYRCFGDVELALSHAISEIKKSGVLDIETKYLCEKKEYPNIVTNINFSISRGYTYDSIIEKIYVDRRKKTLQLKKEAHKK